MSNQNRRNIAALVAAAGTVAMAGIILIVLNGSTEILNQMVAAAVGVPTLVGTFAIVARIHTDEE
jgi:hypothetical protein